MALVASVSDPPEALVDRGNEDRLRETVAVVDADARDRFLWGHDWDEGVKTKYTLCLNASKIRN